MAKKYSTLGIKRAEFELLLKKLGSQYLEQLYIYVTEKKKRNQIGSEKGYLFWILKKSPPIESLLSYVCRDKKEQAKAEQEKQQLLEDEKQQRSRREKENTIVTNLLEKYYSKLTVNQLLQLQSEFWKSVYGQGLTRWKSQLDFGNHLVAASLKRYIYRKHILQA
jgi:hypothetical protein